MKFVPPATRYYVYALLDPRKPGSYSYALPNGKRATFDHEPFYIGKGTGKRAHQHVPRALVESTLQTFKDRKIRRITASGHTVIEQKCKGLFSEEAAFNLEQALIRTIGRHNTNTGPLTNLTDGGDGFVNLVFTKAHRAKLRAAKLGGVLSEEHRASIGASGKGRIGYWTGKSISEEHREKIRVGNLGKDGGFLGWSHDADARALISAKLTGTKHPMVTCPHCDKVGGNNTMKRWHFDNCKMR